MKKAIVLIIKFYQVTVSRLLSARCRFYPSCSQYAIEAVEKHGLTKGMFLAVKRVSRCHPLNPGGYDPVP